MQKQFFLLVLGLFLQSGFAQQILEVDADVIGINYPHRLTFYKENSDGSYDKTILHPFEKEIVHFTQLGKHDDLIRVTTLKKESPKKLIRALNKGIFLIQEKNAHYLSLEKNRFIKTGSYQQVDGKPEWQYNFSYYFNYSLVCINQKITLVYFNSNRNNRYYGFFLPKKENSIFSFKTNGDFPLEKKHEFQEVKRKEFPVKTLDTISAPLNLKFKTTEDHQLVGYYSHKVVLDKNFDTLYTKNGFIIGRKNQKTLLYNQKLENITPKKLRVIEFMKNRSRYDYSYPQILVNNQIRWLSQDGKLLENYEEASNCYGGGGWTSKADFIRITQKDGEIWLQDALLSKDNTYEKAWFLNKNQELDIQRNYRINLYNNYLIVRKNKKYGLVKYTFNEEKTALETQLILPVQYDFIYPELFNAEEQGLIIENNNSYGLLLLKTEDLSLTKPLATDELTLPIIYDDIKYLGKCQPFLLKKDQQYGYSGIQESPRYKNLEKFNFHFARFTLPNGKKGWLDLEGNEYLDE